MIISPNFTSFLKIAIILAIVLYFLFRPLRINSFYHQTEQRNKIKKSNQQFTGSLSCLESPTFLRRLHLAQNES